MIVPPSRQRLDGFHRFLTLNAGSLARLPRPVTDHSFDSATSLHYQTLPDHEFYQKQCQDHARFVATCKTFWERVIIYDVAPL